MAPPRIVYIFTSIHNGGADTPWDPCCSSASPMAEWMKTEGFHIMWERLLREGTISGCLSVVESARCPGTMQFRTPGHSCVVMPHIDRLDALLRPGDIIVARGGFRPWPPFLTRMNRQGRWVLFYRAATNRLKWPQWDVVLDDLEAAPLSFNGRLHVAFNKPVNPEVFHFQPRVKKEFDLIITAAHIHDKKGQWKVVEGLLAHRRKYGRALRACMPGRFTGGAYTRAMFDKARELDVDMPGMVPRSELNNLYARSKVFVHLGGAGQNDRGVLEALACGVPVILGSPQYHAPFTFKDWRYCIVAADQLDPGRVADDIEAALSRWAPDTPRAVATFYEAENGLDTVVLPQMRRLIGYCAANPVDRRAIIDEYGAKERVPRQK